MPVNLSCFDNNNCVIIFLMENFQKFKCVETFWKKNIVDTCHMEQTIAHEQQNIDRNIKASRRSEEKIRKETK